MPASARLLQKLREAWGEDVVQDFVTWVGEAHSVSRAELRELADLYFARISDRLEERIALAETRWGAKLDERINGVRLEIAALREDVAFQMRDQMKWMFVFWIGTLVPLAGLIVALGKNWL